MNLVIQIHPAGDAEGQWREGGEIKIPKGFNQSARCCEERATPGDGQNKSKTLNGFYHGEKDSTLSELSDLLGRLPGVAFGNAGLNDWNPFRISEMAVCKDLDSVWIWFYK
jgi:hypothetical protein